MTTQETPASAEELREKLRAAICDYVTADDKMQALKEDLNRAYNEKVEAMKEVEAAWRASTVPSGSFRVYIPCLGYKIVRMIPDSMNHLTVTFEDLGDL